MDNYQDQNSPNFQNSLQSVISSVPENKDLPISTEAENPNPINENSTGINTNPPNNSASFNPTPIKKSSRNKKMIATFLGILLLMGGIGAGVFLTQRSQNFKEKAKVIEENATEEIGNPNSNNQKSENTSVEKVENTYNVGFFCSKLGIYTVNGDLEDPSKWKELSASESAKLKEGDTVYFVINGSETSGYGSIDKAKIIVNGQEYEGILRNTGIMCMALVGASCPISFYIKYTIPKGIYSFKVEAKLHHRDPDKWF